MRERFYNPNAEIDYSVVLRGIQKNVRQYLIDNKINALIIGISGGIDSGLNAAILSPICKDLNIPLIGRYIHIESNTNEEMERAKMVGNVFCGSDNFKVKKFDIPYELLLTHFEEPSVFGGFNHKVTNIDDKIRRGNIKARMRMMYLYNLSQKLKGIVVDNDNMTEYLLGFYTLHGGGDISPLYSLLKTEVFELAKYYINCLEKQEEKDALQAVIDAVPTDGLGITSSDVEQFGVKTYDEVDDILVHHINGNGYENPLTAYLYPKYGEEVVNKVLSRYNNTAFKRNHPFRILV